jgi:hypothetical protein
MRRWLGAMTPILWRQDLWVKKKRRLKESHESGYGAHRIGACSLSSRRISST